MSLAASSSNALRRRHDRYGPWAIIAGASEGIGAAFAEALARDGVNLVLVARRIEPLQALASELRAAQRVEVVVLACDLGRPDAAETIAAAVVDHEVGTLIYNAAYAPRGEFLDQPRDDKLQSIDVNCRGPVLMIDTFAPAMIRRRRGAIILLSSMAGGQGTATLACYAASKAYDWVLAESLWDEFRGHGVDVLACCAGATRTPGYLRSRPRLQRAAMDPARVAHEALSMLGRRPSMIPGAKNRLAAFLLARLLPRKQAVQIMGRETRRTYED